MEGAFWWCFVIPALIFPLYHIVRMWILTEHDSQEKTPIQIDLTPFWDAFNNTFAGTKYGGFSKYQQPTDEKRKNDDDEVFDEKRKRLEEDEDESYWVVGDDGELVEKRKR